ncbi:MAG: malate synthase A [Acidobacteriota bacterium]
MTTTASISESSAAGFTECQQEILNPGAVAFLRELHKRFEPTRRQLLEARVERQAYLDRGGLPDFLPETKEVRDAEWAVAPIPPELLDRRVEITGPTERKMVINALNSGAKVFMADFEDANSPTWMNCIEGQRNLIDANTRTISWTSTDNRFYELGPKPAVLFVRPRGWHMVEKHFVIDETPISASLFDFGLYLFHNAQILLQRGSAPYFYLPKLESHLEARLWNDVFVFAQQYLGIPNGTIRATVLIETILAAFEMDEILYELRDHSAGLNCGRWDYIFSFIKKFRNRREFTLPQRGDVTMTQPFLASYVELLIHTCHKRGIHAMGGMAAQIPIRNDEAANREAMQRVREDKLREVRAGHDGTWVAHPGLVPVAQAVFDESMPGANQIRVPAERRSRIQAANLLEVPRGPITEAGLRRNIDVALQYMESWLRGNGCVPIYNLMEDAATAEISRAQLWQWIRYGALLDDGRVITADVHNRLLAEILEEKKNAVTPEAFLSRKFNRAADLLRELSAGPFREFLTTTAYQDLA